MKFKIQQSHADKIKNSKQKKMKKQFTHITTANYGNK